jgi:hypothetical protein
MPHPPIRAPLKKQHASTTPVRQVVPLLMQRARCKQAKRRRLPTPHDPPPHPGMTPHPPPSQLMPPAASSTRPAAVRAVHHYFKNNPPGKTRSSGSERPITAWARPPHAPRATPPLPRPTTRARTHRCTQKTGARHTRASPAHGPPLACVNDPCFASFFPSEVCV